MDRNITSLMSSKTTIKPKLFIIKVMLYSVNDVYVIKHVPILWAK